MVGEKEEEVGLRRRRSRAGRAANKLPEPLSGISRVCRRQGVIWFDFHNKSSSPEKASSKGTRDTCRRESHRSVTARRRTNCGTMRWGSHGYKIGINEMEHRLSSDAFSISIMNFGSSPTRDGRVERNAGGLRRARSARRCRALGFSRGTSRGLTIIGRSSRGVLRS